MQQQRGVSSGRPEASRDAFGLRLCVEASFVSNDEELERFLTEFFRSCFISVDLVIRFHCSPFVSIRPGILLGSSSSISSIRQRLGRSTTTRINRPCRLMLPLFFFLSIHLFVAATVVVIVVVVVVVVVCLF